jgi:dinuclear metal center YbgI/SA1388 family protein
MKIEQIVNYLESVAPLSLQEDYDNSGLIVGNKKNIIQSALITLDCTEDIVDEAIQKKCNLIIAHHPIIFRGLKKINGKNYIERTIIKAIKNDIAIYAIHTNLDNVINGVNYKIANLLELQNLSILKPKKNQLSNLVFYCPKKYASSVRKELFDKGAGNIGFYNNCSFKFTGQGTFKPLLGSNPFIGSVGKLQQKEEECISLVFPKYLQKDIIKVLKENHPYEEVAYQVYDLENVYQHIGSGIIGNLSNETTITDFLKQLKLTMSTSCIRYTEPKKRKNIYKVAICGGSGSFLLKDAISADADIFISSDFKYHEFFDAEDKIVIADIGHYESEQFTKELIFDMLKEKFPKFAVQLSKINTNPIKYI